MGSAQKRMLTLCRPDHHIGRVYDAEEAMAAIVSFLSAPRTSARRVKREQLAGTQVELDAILVHGERRAGHGR